MFIVKNITTLDVDIPDLHVTLSPNQKLDLDMVTSRFYIDQSGVLKNLLRTNKLQCIIKDGGINPVKKIEPIAEKSQATQVDVLNAVKSLEAKIEKRITEKVSTQQPNVDMTAFNQALSALQTLVNNNAGNKQSNTNTEDVDEKTLIEMQKRTLNRIVTKTESSVKHDVQTTDRDVAKNAEELEGLL